MGVIYWFSAQSNSNTVTELYFGFWNFLVRKCAHLFEYAVLFILVHWACRRIFFAPYSSSKKAALALALTLSFSYALTDEWHQAFVAGRSASWQDILIDSCGIMIGALFCLLLARITQKKRP